MTEPVAVTERSFTAEQRKALAAKGHAMPDGSFPIENEEDLASAIRLAGNADHPDAARAHIKKRARALGLADRIPTTWEADHSAGNGASQPGSANDFHLRESVDAPEISAVDAGGAHLMEVTLIRAGQSKMGNIYSTQVLESALPLFEGARAFVDHPRPDGLPERSVRDLAGYYRNAHLAEGRVRAQLHLLPGNEQLYALLKEAENNPALCGLSIDAWAEAESRTPPVTVRAIHAINSVDIVTRPSAGGQIDRVLHSDRPKEDTMPPDPSAPTAPAAPTQEAAPPTPPQPPAQPTTQPAQPSGPDLAQLLEGLTADRARMQAELERVTRILAPDTSAPVDPTTELAALAESIRRENAEMVRQRDIARCEHTLTTTMAESDLPRPVAAKLERAFTGKIFEASALQAAIDEEKAILAALTPIGLVQGNGFEKLQAGMSEYDQLQAAFDALFDLYESDAARTLPRLSGIREAYRVATGADIQTATGLDRPVLEAFQAGMRAKARSGRLTEAEVLLREADVTTASFSYLLGTSMNKRLLSEYQAWPSEWQKFTAIVSVKDFKQQDRVRLGAFGSLSTVAEDAAYTTLTIADTRAIYTPTKRGNLVQITRETIVNDDLYSIKQIPQKLAVAAAFTLAEFVYNLLAPNFGNIYDAHPLFDSVNHLNSAVIAANLNTPNSGGGLTSANLQTGVIKMRKQTNLASKPIGLKPRYVLVPPDLEFTAMTILKSAGLPGGNNNDINPMMGYAEPIVAPQLNALTAGPASTTSWILVADPKVIDTLEVGFVGGQANPVLLVQDMPLYGINFTQDVISYKVRHEYGGAVVDYRGFYLGNN